MPGSHPTPTCPEACYRRPARQSGADGHERWRSLLRLSEPSRPHGPRRREDPLQQVQSTARLRRKGPASTYAPVSLSGGLSPVNSRMPRERGKSLSQIIDLAIYAIGATRYGTSTLVQQLRPETHPLYPSHVRQEISHASYVEGGQARILFGRVRLGRSKD